MKKSAFIFCLNCGEPRFTLGTEKICSFCKSTEFSEPKMFYSDFCTYCLCEKRFTENIDNPKCPDCGFQIDIQNDPLSEVKAAIVDVKSGYYTPFLWLAIIILSLFLMFMAVT